MPPYWSDETVALYLGDCLDVLRGMEPASVDAIVTDPPAAIGFMGKDWDSNLGSRDRWIEWLTARMAEAARVLKPGGHALVWALPRTSGWTQIALEDAGFEVRDCISHIFGSGFPKSLDVSKAIDKRAGAEREVAGPDPFASRKPHGTWNGDAYAQDPYQGHPGGSPVTIPATSEAAQWDGWGTALKPAHEIWWAARKPLAGNVAQNVLAHGTGALNIDGCRVDSAGRPSRVGHGEDTPGKTTYGSGGPGGGSHADGTTDQGRWPANVLLTHSAACEVTGTRIIRGDNRAGKQGQRPGGFFDTGAQAGDAEPNGPLHGDTEADVWACAPGCPVADLDRQSGVLTSGANPTRRGSDVFSRDIYGDFAGQRECVAHRGADAGGASRFFPVFRYEAKAPSSERPRGVDGSAHPTVKPLDLMSWLVRLVTPPGGIVLDPFAGSGTTAEACIVEGFRCVLIEKYPAYAELIKTRLAKPIQPVLFGEGF